jgi:hypothetical protein
MGIACISGWCSGIDGASIELVDVLAREEPIDGPIVPRAIDRLERLGNRAARELR